MHWIRFFFGSLIIFCNSISQSQDAQLDSLRDLLKTEKIDTSIVRLHIKIAWKLYPSDAIEARNHADLAILAATKSKNDKYIGDAYNTMGVVKTYTGDPAGALQDYETALSFHKKAGNEKGVASITGNIALVHMDKGQYRLALDYLLESLKLSEKLDLKKFISIRLGNIGIVFKNLKEYDNALRYYRKAYNLDLELNNETGQARHLANMANVYMSLMMKDSAMHFFQKATLISEKINNIYILQNNYGNMALLMGTDDLNGAIDYTKKALEMAIELKDLTSISRHNGHLASFYRQLQQPQNAIPYINEALKIAELNQLQTLLKDQHLFAAQIYADLQDYHKAYNHITMHLQFKDSLQNQDNTRAMTQMEMQYQYEQEQLQDSLKRAELKYIEDAKQKEKDARNEAQIKQQRMLSIAGGIGMVLALGIVTLLWRSNRQKKKTNKLITAQKNEVEIQKQHAEQMRTEAELQKHKVEEKNKEILDSITYARRLQDAILPPIKSFKNKLPESFVLYKPKDIVAGDFYWLETVPSYPTQPGGQNVETILFAAADCTGHGVPGAMVSVVCANALNKSVKEEKLLEPGKILSRAREIIIEQFDRSEQEVKDGMDISMVALTHVGTDGQLSLQWAGANNPLWIIRKDSTIVEDIRPDKQPVGKHTELKPFTTHTMDLQKGDTLYIFTDGYQDQFGGPDNKKGGKKFKASTLKELLLSITKNDMELQKELLDATIEKWKNPEGGSAYEQIDDICIIGVRL